MSMREDVLRMVEEAIQAVYPEDAVKKALANFDNGEGIKIIAIGKATWRMAKAARS